MGKRKSRGPRIITQDGPTQAVIGVRPAHNDGIGKPPTLESARELGRMEGRTSMLGEQQKSIDEKIDRVRADAQALETAARILHDAPRGIFQVPHKAETVAALFALAAGMRIAADSFPHSSDVPF